MIRLNKYLAASGLGSRRAMDALIAAGKVQVDGRRATAGATVDPLVHRVTVNGRTVTGPNSRPLMTIVLNKPRGVITSMRDERGRPSVATLLPDSPRLFPVGRLDAQTTGLLVCTNDGALAQFLLNPANEIARVYRVTVAGALPTWAARELGARNITPARDGHTIFSLTLHEGRNRQVRRMCARQGLRVVALERTQFGPLHLGKLKIGSTRMLAPDERRELSRLRGER
jgi:23S rRNA pseudouridine2605 synthase